jgi:hypothetical protein
MLPVEALVFTKSLMIWESQIPSTGANSVFRDMTPAHIREPKGAAYVEVLFLESARFYRLPRAHASFARILGVLEEAVIKQRVLRVRCTPPDGDLIEEVREPRTSKE